jgi:hypothetical protein
MSWNYWVMKHVTKNEMYEKHPTIFEPTYTWHAIHEVYYLGETEDDCSYTKEPMTLVADTPEDLAEMFEMMKAAFSKPVLYYGD